MPMAASHVTNTVDTNSRRGGYFVSGVRKGLYFTGGNREMATGKSGGRRGGGTAISLTPKLTPRGGAQSRQIATSAWQPSTKPPRPTSLPSYLACRER